jgi:MFS family permease
MKTYSSPASRRLHISCLILALGPFVWGYNIGVLASVLVHPGFLETLGGHDEHNASPFPRALITSVYYLGTFLSYLFLAHPVADRLGRRYAAVLGMMVTCLGQALQAGAVRPHALGMVLTGRIIAGLGIAVISTSVPLYQR